MIDWEWVGFGPCVQDVMYLLVSSSHIDCLTDPAVEKALLAHYHAQLPAAARASYPLPQLQQDYELALLDFLRWLVCGKWKTLTPDGMRADANSYGRVLPNRSVPHARWLVQRANRILAGSGL